MKRKEFERLINIEEDFIPTGKTNRPGSRNSLEYITIHNTDNTKPGADARAHATFVTKTGYRENKETGKKTWVSWHYTVDDKRVIQHLPVTEACFHTLNGKGSRMNGNSRSIAIEICMNQGIDQKAAFLRAARLTATLMHDLKKSIDEVIPHHFWTGKACPSLLLDNGKPGKKWKSFLDTIVSEYSLID